MSHSLVHYRETDGSYQEVSHVKPLPVTGSTGGNGSLAGGGGGDLSVYYAKPSGTNADGTAAYASATTLTVTGLPYAFTARDIVSVEQYNSSGAYVATWTPENTTITVSGTTITVADAAFASDDELVVAFLLPPKSIDPNNNTQDTQVINPIWSRYSGSTLADVTNDTDGTDSYYITNDGFSINGFHMVLDNGSGTVTVTIEASMQDDGTAASSAAYVDVTQAVFGQASFTGADSPAYIVDDVGMLATAKFIKVKVVTSTGGSNDADFTIYHKRLYR